MNHYALSFERSLQFISFTLVLAIVITFLNFFQLNSKIDLVNLWSCIGTIDALVITISALSETRIENEKNRVLQTVNNLVSQNSNLFQDIYHAIPNKSGEKVLLHGSLAIKTVIGELNNGNIEGILKNFGFYENQVYLSHYSRMLNTLLLNKNIAKDEIENILLTLKFRNTQLTSHLKPFLTEMIKVKTDQTRSISESLDILNEIEVTLSKLYSKEGLRNE